MKTCFRALSLATLIIFVITCTSSIASPVSYFDSTWTPFADDDGHVGPGGGGQKFDAEYLYYKVEDNLFSIGLQTGFNLSDGYQYSSVNPKHYYSGDLALSFDNDSSVYEYAFDFGFLTKGFSLNNVEADNDNDGKDSAGLYRVTTWNLDVYPGHTSSNPFAMDAGSLIAAVDDINTQNIYVDFETTIDGKSSNARIVTFDLADLYAEPGFQFTGLDVHWTMSCGNDVINGSAPAPVPEPSTFLLFGVGGGLLWLVRRRTK